MASTEIHGRDTREVYSAVPDTRSWTVVNVGQTERLLSIIGGSGLALYGLLRRDWTGITLAGLSVPIISRGATGHCFVYQAFDITTVERSPGTIAAIPAKEGIRVRRAMTINRSPEDLYTFWHDVEKAPLYMQSIESVTQTGDRTSRWTAKGLFGRKIEWNAELLQDMHGKPATANADKVSFDAAPEGRGTVVTLELDYLQFQGPLGVSLGNIVGHAPEHEVMETLRHFKELMEAGEIPTIKEQPTGKVR